MVHFPPVVSLCLKAVWDIYINDLSSDGPFNGLILYHPFCFTVHVK